MVILIKDLKRRAAERGAECRVQFDTERGLILIRVSRDDGAFLSPVDMDKLSKMGRERQALYLASVVDILADRLDMSEKERYADGIGRPEK